MSDHPYLPWPVFRRSAVAAFARSLTFSPRLKNSNARSLNREAAADSIEAIVAPRTAGA